MKISIVVPIYPMQNHAELLWRCIHSIMIQTFKDYEIVITEEGTMPENTNEGIKRSGGEFIKILYMDDYFAHEEALRDVVDCMEANISDWLITGVNNNPSPYLTTNILEGNNKLGSPSALTIKNKDPLLFDERLSWLLDCDYYHRMLEERGDPMILSGVNVIMGEHEGQKSHTMSDEDKQLEVNYLKEKYDTSS